MGSVPGGPATVADGAERDPGLDEMPIVGAGMDPIALRTVGLRPGFFKGRLIEPEREAKRMNRFRI